MGDIKKGARRRHGLSRKKSKDWKGKRWPKGKTENWLGGRRYEIKEVGRGDLAQ